MYEKVWAQPTVKVAAEFGISDVALAKVCRKMNVPKPPPGYWRRIETGAKINKPPLPETSKKTTDFVYLRISSPDSSDRVSGEIQSKIDAEYLPENLIKISDNLDDAHPLVKKTARYFEDCKTVKGKATNFSDDSAEDSDDQQILNIEVSAQQFTRALLIMDALIKACEKRGYEVIVATDRWGEETRIVKEGEEVWISLYENQRKVEREMTPAERKKPPYLLTAPAEYEAGGKLSVKIKLRWSYYQKWSDRQKEPLENRLNEVMVGIVALLEHQVFEKRRKDEEERLRQEAIKRKEEEDRRREKLEADVRAWRKSEDIKAYLDAFEQRAIKEKGVLDPDSPEGVWLAWARRYAESVDPLNKLFATTATTEE